MCHGLGSTGNAPDWRLLPDHAVHHCAVGRAVRCPRVDTAVRQTCERQRAFAESWDRYYLSRDRTVNATPLNQPSSRHPAGTSGVRFLHGTSQSPPCVHPGYCGDADRIGVRRQSRAQPQTPEILPCTSCDMVEVQILQTFRPLGIGMGLIYDGGHHAYPVHGSRESLWSALRPTREGALLAVQQPQSHGPERARAEVPPVPGC